MSSFVDLSGLDRLKSRMRQIQDPDATPLMATWMDIIAEDNRKGVLAGLDKDGNPMRPVTYRPKTPKPIKIGSKAAADLRNREKARARYGKFAGLGAHAAGANNNLTRKQYEQLDGPPLAPRRQFSRVVTNLRTAYEKLSSHSWTAYGLWFEVVSVKGVPFLPAHFQGLGVGRGKRFKLPTRNLAGVRPEGRLKARRAAVAWMADQIRSAFSRAA